MTCFKKYQILLFRSLQIIKKNMYNKFAIYFIKTRHALGSEMSLHIYFFSILYINKYILNIREEYIIFSLVSLIWYCCSVTVDGTPATTAPKTSKYLCLDLACLGLQGRGLVRYCIFMVWGCLRSSLARRKLVCGQ